MVITTWTGRFAAVAVGGLLLALAVNGAAYAISSNAFTYSAARNGYYTINHYQLVPKNTSTAEHFYNSQSGLGVDAAGCFNAGVHLPDGSVISTLAISYRAAAGNITVALLRQNFMTVSLDSIADLTSSNTGGDNKTKSTPSAPSFSTVDNRNYGYSIEVCLSDPADAFYAARVGYQYTNAGD